MRRRRVRRVAYAFRAEERDTDAPERQELARERDLLDRIRADDVAKFNTKDAHVDWSAGQSIQYTFHAFSEKPRYN